MEHDDYQCPRCGEWLEAPDVKADGVVLDRCLQCDFKFLVMAFVGRLNYVTECLSDQHKFEEIMSGGLPMLVCMRCKKTARRC